jgi:molybdopterin converting factor small subunit
MKVKILFHSYFKNLTGCAETFEELPNASTISDLQNRLFARFPELEKVRRSALIAVDLEYQPPDFILKEGDEISFFPPVQGG